MDRGIAVFAINPKQRAKAPTPADARRLTERRSPECSTHIASVAPPRPTPWLYCNAQP